MPTFVTLIKFTQTGIEAIKDGPTRLDAAKRAYEAVGAKLKGFYLVTGRYDAIAILPTDRHQAAEGRHQVRAPGRQDPQLVQPHPAVT